MHVVGICRNEEEKTKVVDVFNTKIIVNGFKILLSHLFAPVLPLAET